MAIVNLVTTCIGQCDSMRIGKNSYVGEPSGAFNTAIGVNARTCGIKSTAIGAYANAFEVSTAIGAYSSAERCGATSVGASTVANGVQTTVVGTAAQTCGDRAVAVGAGSFAGGYTVAIGRNAYGAIGSVAIGTCAREERDRGVAIGANAHTTGQREIVIKSGDSDDGSGNWRSDGHGAAGLKIKGATSCETNAVQFAVNGKLVSMTGCAFRKMLVDAGGTVTTL